MTPVTSRSEKPDARVARTRALLNEAMLVLVQSKPIDDITIRELVLRAGISYPTFFRHHPDLSSVLEEVADQFLKDLLVVALPLFEGGDTSTASLAMAQYISDNWPLSRALLAGGAGGTVRQEFVRQALETATHLPGKHMLWLPAGLGIPHVVNATIGLLAWWLNAPEPISAAQMGALIDKLVITPAMNP
jgi:AcrR family transcriptional regulator